MSRKNTNVSIIQTSDILPDGEGGHHIVHTHLMAKLYSQSPKDAIGRLGSMLNGKTKSDNEEIEIHFSYEQIGGYG